MTDGAVSLPATPEKAARVLLRLAEASGNYRRGAYEVAQVLDRCCPDNGSKICAIAVILAAGLSGETASLRRLLIEALPLLIDMVESVDLTLPAAPEKTQ